MDKIREITGWMESLRNTKNIDGMARFGINSSNAYGIPTPEMIKKAKEIGRDHQFALALWETGIHEARIIATMVADPKLMTPELMDHWTAGFDSWDVCDQCCLKLYRYTDHVDQKIRQWASHDDTFIKRASFALIATHSVSDKCTPDEEFLPYFNLIIKASTDERNFVKKAVNWALRQMGKRSRFLNTEAIGVCQRLLNSGDTTARWIASDALRELRSEKILARIKR